MKHYKIKCELELSAPDECSKEEIASRVMAVVDRTKEFESEELVGCVCENVRVYEERV